jgi:hypothetical protein
MTALHEIARTAADWFETARRADDSGSFVRLKDGAPEWIGEAVHDAHGAAFLPDDYRYAYAREAFELIADAGEDADLDELADEFADGVDIYTGALLEWASSNLQRIGYVDEARDEFGASSFNSVTNELMAGQAAERREVFGAIRDAVEEREDNPYPDDNPMSRLDATEDPDERDRIRNGAPRGGNR